MKQAEKLRLGGHDFTYAKVMTVRQDLFAMTHARHAGLVGARRAEDETPEEFMRRLMDGLLSSGRALLLMGALLVPYGMEPKQWTVEVAMETADVLGAIEDAAEKQRLYVELASALLAFFSKGLGSWIGSATASADESGETKQEMANAPSPGESGQGSSELSEATTPSDTITSSA